jgi:23S rRNA (uracil-5-)-methyltransferase RumA
MAEPKCAYFGRCGGCGSQHIDYPAQLENKRRLVAACCGFPDVKVFSGNEYGYRNRMDFIFHSSGLGFRMKGEWKSIVDVKRCEISEERLNSLLSEVRSFFTRPDWFDSRRKTGTFRYAVIRTPGCGSSISFVLNPDSMKVQEAIGRINEFAKVSSADNIVVTYVEPNTDISISDENFVVKGSGMLKEKLLGNGFLYSVQGFFQNNTAMADRMHEYCHALLGKYDTKDAHLLDLYGGVGTFGINNASLFRGVTIVEGVKQAIDAAQGNIMANHAENARAIVSDDRHLKKIELPSPLYVITDPPRSGMHPDAIQYLNRSKPAVIIYISCNPEQMKKDLPKFREYDTKSVAVFDLFPQTPHCETVVELVRKG